MRKFFWIILVIFFLSRFCFLANFPHFYDSPEYFRESTNNSFFSSLARSHESIHPVWLFLTQTFQKIVPQNNVWEISLISAIFGLIGFLAFYFLIKRNFGEKIAIFSSVPLFFFPHLWLIQTNVLHESLDCGLFLSALLFFDFFLDKLDKKKLAWFLMAVIFLSLAIFDFVGILLWMPVFLGWAIFKSKKLNWHQNLGWSLGIIIASFLIAITGLYGLLSLSQTIDPTFRLKSLLLGYGGGGIFSGWNILNILRMLRNDGLILFYGYSLAAILGLMITGFYLVKQKKWPLIIFLLTFFLPFIIIGKFWYGGLFGRYSVLIAYPLALLLALMPWRKIYGIMILILFLSFLPTFIAYQKTPIPQIEASLIDKINLKENDILILSDYQRPQLDYRNALYLNGDEKMQKAIEENIDKKLLQGDRVFISQQAINFPYWQYDGQQIHIISKGNKIHLISKGNKDKAQLKEFLKDKEKELVAEDKEYPLLAIYQIRTSPRARTLFFK